MNDQIQPHMVLPVLTSLKVLKAKLLLNIEAIPDILVHTHIHTPWP